MKRKTAFVFHELCLWHHTGSAALVVPSGLTVQPDNHIENPEGKRRAKNLLDVSGILNNLAIIKPNYADVSDVACLHKQDYIDKIKKESDAGGGNSIDDVPLGKGSYEIALLAAGGCMAAVDAVMKRQVDNAYALVRPPGHHAEADIGKGFCIFNNAVIAIKHAQKIYNIQKIAHIDWDAHHGNGTQSLFYDDPNVLTISIHQDSWYPPNQGKIEELGCGTNINLPLFAGSGQGAYLEVFEKIIMPAVKKFSPDLITVSCGLDASIVDPLSRQLCTSETFVKMTELVMNLSDNLCQGKLVFFHEGGYSPQYVPYCVLAIIETLSGYKTAIDDPFLENFNQKGGGELQPHQKELIEKWCNFFKMYLN